MKSFTLFTMKSKTSLDEIKAYGLDEIKSVFLSAKGDFICKADFIHAVDLSRRKTDLVKKRLFRRIVFFLAESEGFYPRTKKRATGTLFAHCGAPSCSPPPHLGHQKQKRTNLRLVRFHFGGGGGSLPAD